MRIAILADIHANYQALQAVLADIKNQNIDDIISLGDNVGYGPQPDEVVQELMAQDIFSITGNHELALHDKKYYKGIFILENFVGCVRYSMLKWFESYH